MADEGATVIAVSDTGGAIVKRDGLDVDRVISWKKEHGTVVGFPGSETITNAELLELPCEILIPAALENQITGENAGRIKARIIGEAANGPTTPEADEILYANGAFVIPDILANAGGVTVSYFEWVQNRQGYYWQEERVLRELERYMVDAFDSVLQASVERKVNMRIAAFIVAIQRVAHAAELRGLYA